MKGLRKYLLLCFLASMAVILSIGCSSNDKADTIRLAEVTRSIFYAPQYVAISEGFFEEEGIEVDLTTTWGGDTTMTTLLANGADVALVGAETSIYVYAQDANDPPINFAALTQTDGTFLVSRKPIENFQWEMLNGTTFLGQRKGGMPQMVGEHVLKKHGINPRTDLNLIQNIDFGNIPSAFASGTGEFVQLFEPTATQFEIDGIGHIVASFGAESGTVPYTGYMAKQSYIEKNKDVLERFTKALYRAQQWVQTSSTEEIARSIQPFFNDTPIEIIENVVENYKSQESYATAPRIKEEAWENLHTIMEQAGELPMHVDYEALVNTEIAENVMK